MSIKVILIVISEFYILIVTNGSNMTNNVSEGLDNFISMSFQLNKKIKIFYFY